LPRSEAGFEVLSANESWRVIYGILIAFNVLLTLLSFCIFPNPSIKDNLKNGEINKADSLINLFYSFPSDSDREMLKKEIYNPEAATVTTDSSVS
jgi:hypothetical protein